MVVLQATRRLKHIPTLGRNFETMDPLEWLARIADHIPDPVRGDRAAEEPGEGKVEEKPAKKRRCTASWARLIAKVFPLTRSRVASAGGSPRSWPTSTTR
jgi:hypothetical protein